ncbi:MAG: LUD domain-containing protein [Anaerolineales bacterium]|nr:LUD domain-containing protein [Anaerolineales bacterium]
MTQHQFRPRIRQSLANPTLQAALDANTRRRLAGRQAAFESLPDHAERRQRARRIKADLVTHLDEYLAQFIEQVTANGIIVHHAVDANQAVQVILDICHSARAAPVTPLLVAKSKSMVSEEIELNHALEANSIRVVETDLGEYIVQLRGERPSHIITPAVHLRRDDVGRLFTEKLGIPYTEDIPTLTNTARRVLRDVFLSADVGFSGVNFGVVETGTLCVVTNEGNGRMVTTLPPVHIALMGMERLVPSLDDLALFLSLLPRSATGQKLSVYTSLIHSPLPGQTRHLVILDNGRSALRQSELAEALYCIRCGACLNACPVFRELGGHAYGSIYPGPIGSVISSSLVDPQFAYLSQASSLCGACKEVCPVDIDLPGLLLRIRAGEEPRRSKARAGETKKHKRKEGVGIPGTGKLGLKAFRFAALTPGLFAVGQRLLGLGARLVSPRHGWIRLPAMTGWGYSKDFPLPALRPFRARFNRTGRKDSQVLRGAEKPEAALEKEAPLSPQMDNVEQFTAELAALGGETIRCRADELSKRVAAFLGARGVERVLVDATGAWVLKGTGFKTVSEPDPSVQYGLTGSVAGVAETGSLLVVGSEPQALKASLLPEVHLAILKQSALYASLPQILALPEFSQAPAAAIITGPSRTADIEMTLTIGVHGPGELIVFLVDEM